MKRVLIWLLAFLFAAFAGIRPEAQAQNGNTILRKVEDSLTAPNDRVAIMKMDIIDKNGNTKYRQIKIYQKGKHKRLIRFLAPPDVKGVSFLSLSDEDMWLYMPAFHKIRRIASHVKNENFMGTDFTYDDMAQSNYTEKYSAKILKSDDVEIVLELTPKPGKNVGYKKLVMTVDKKSYLPTKIEFTNKNGELQKILSNSSIEKIDGYWTPKVMTMQDVLKQHKTVMISSEIKNNIGLKASIFTKRFLKRSE